MHIGGLFAVIAVAAIKIYLKEQMNIENKLDQLKKLLKIKYRLGSLCNLLKFSCFQFSSVLSFFFQVGLLLPAVFLILLRFFEAIPYHDANRLINNAELLTYWRSAFLLRDIIGEFGACIFPFYIFSEICKNKQIKIICNGLYF